VEPIEPTECALDHCAIPTCLANLCYIYNLWPNWEVYLLLFNMGYMIHIHPGPVFQCEFNGGVSFVSIFVNFSKCTIYTPLGSVFQSHQEYQNLKSLYRKTYRQKNRFYTKGPIVIRNR